MEQFIFEMDDRARDSKGDDLITIAGDEHFHLSRVLRAREGDRILATDGHGVTCLCFVQRIGKDSSTCKVMEEYRDLNLSRRRFCVAMSVLKPVSKLEFAIEKCTELGAADFLLFNSERSGKAVIRLERMAGIARSAVKQSLQSRIPGLTFVEGLEEVVSQSHPYEEKFVLHEQSADMIDKFLPPMKEDTSVIALIGPEGGFSREEVGFLAGRGFKIVSVGRSRLRSETAAIKIASLLGVY